ncbi:hypothetical protein MCW_01395 [Cardidatus Bartonella washoeensis 085-0475]|uniref:Uncharacterized protein n=1 Tax=Cardidatus Bartonella washoeensis 085-0475 TaxID=1094564 RepID=J0QCN3_9HYPH|nr:hypothetical protein MCW_01395 [Bartonella washoeensis 085-0475]
MKSIVCKNIAITFGDNGPLALHSATLTFEVTHLRNISAINKRMQQQDGTEPVIGFIPKTEIQNEDKYTKIEVPMLRQHEKGSTDLKPGVVKYL